jgi:enoyl-CoA hydratase/carnithine racemase
MDACQMLDLIDHGTVREIRLNRPPVNAMNPALVDRLNQELVTAGEQCEAVVLSGREGMFSAGLDVPELLGLEPGDMGVFWSGFIGLLETVARMPVPTVAAITGHSPAGGAVISLFCDYRIMSGGNYRIGLNETQVGLMLPRTIQGALVRLVGPHRAERLIVSGAMLLPEQALQAGLVDELADGYPATLAGALGWCEAHLALPRHAMLGNRKTMRHSLTSLFDADDAVESQQEFVNAWFDDGTQATLKALVASLGKK